MRNEPWHLTVCVICIFSAPAHPGTVDKRTLQEQTALLLAVSYEHLSCVRCLLEAGADPDISSKNKETPLYKGTAVKSIFTTDLGKHIIGNCITAERFVCFCSLWVGECGHGESHSLLRGHCEPAVWSGLDGPPRGCIQGQHWDLWDTNKCTGHNQPIEYLQRHTSHCSSSARTDEGTVLPYWERYI